MAIDPTFIFLPLISECVLAVFFIYILVTRGTQKGRNLLLISLVGMLLLMIGAFIEVLRINATPLGPPPEIWEEGYYDGQFVRSGILMKAQIDGVILFSLFISCMCVKYQEALIEEKVKEVSIESISSVGKRYLRVYQTYR